MFESTPVHIMYNRYNHVFVAGNEGTHFVFSFPPGWISKSFETEIRITSREKAQVTLLNTTSENVISVPSGGNAIYVGDSSERVTHGLEDKGFELTSDTPVSVTIGCPDYRDATAPDSMLLRPLSADDTDFVITSFKGSSSSSSSKPQSFFAITASEDDTTIDIYDNNRDSYTTQLLNKWVPYFKSMDLNNIQGVQIVRPNREVPTFPEREFPKFRSSPVSETSFIFIIYSFIIIIYLFLL